MKKIPSSTLLLSFYASTQLVSSAAVIILNSGFEDPIHSRNDGTNPANWIVVETVTGSNTNRQVRTKNDKSHTGVMSVQLGAGNSNHSGELYQTVTTSIGTEYIFSIWGRSGGTNPTQNFVASLVSGTGVAGLELASVSDGGTLTNTHQEYTVNFTANATETTIWIRDTSSASASDGTDVALDDVSITAVPEPSSMVLVSLGAFSLMLRRRRK